MKWICRILRGGQIFLGIIASLVLIDMLILEGKIKLWIIAIANTTDASPFSTDGQSNWIFILGVVIVIGITWLILNKLKEKKRKQ